MHVSVAVRPNKPELELTAASATELSLAIRAPHALKFLPPGTRHFVRYRSEYDEVGRWPEGFSGQSHQLNETKPLSGLTPYAEYTVEVNLLSGSVSERCEREQPNPRCCISPEIKRRDFEAKKN